eukprot:10223162-Prorocentrum_lima.AAC.1
MLLAGNSPYSVQANARSDGRARQFANGSHFVGMVSPTLPPPSGVAMATRQCLCPTLPFPPGNETTPQHPAIPQ